MSLRRCSLVVSSVFVVASALSVSSTVEAAGRGRSSPFIKTPWGLIPKSQYNAGFTYNPQKLEQYRAAEKQALEQMQQRGPAGATTKKPTTTLKKQ